MRPPSTIEVELRRFDRRRRFVSTTRIILSGLSAAGGWMLLAALADRWLSLPTAVRVVGEGVTAAILLAAFVRAAWTLSRPTAGWVRLAALAEAMDPRWGERLVTVVTQAILPADRQASAVLNVALTEAVTTEIAKHPPAERIRWSMARWPAMALTGVGIGWGVVFMLPSMDARRLVKRQVLALSNVPAVTSMRIELGSSPDTIAPGQPLTIVADVVGGISPAVLQVGPALDALRSVPMEAGPAGRFRVTLLSVQSDIVYRVTAGDAAAGPVRVRVLRRPGVTDEQIALHFPDGRQTEPGPAGDTPLRLPAGTQVTLQFRSTEPLRSALIRSSDQTLPAIAQGDPRTWQARFTASSSGVWSIELTGDNGLTGGRAEAVNIRIDR